MMDSMTWEHHPTVAAGAKGCMNKSGETAIKPLLARERHRAANAPEGLAASGKALGEVACLSPDDALQRLSSITGGLTPDQVED
jgi:hypothetical protein